MNLNLTDINTPLCPAFNELVLEVATELMPQGWDAMPDNPDTLQGLKDYWHANGKVAINSESTTGLFVGDKEAYFAFRAWHDWLHVHYDGGEKWSIPGEALVCDLHRIEIARRVSDPELARFFGDLIEAEVVAANDFYVGSGEWPVDERSFGIGWLHARGWTRIGKLVS